ncbi:hypothetical protein AB0I93_16230 [Streptomyces sp. NPDC049967]|uniref:hypothetical protein n=1 Tax=unclassified Streptomyces TaxID=2593676 RepID=UPI002E0D4933|nr:MULTISPECIES: hypothetical protein [unclassified Streptomyces]
MSGTAGRHAARVPPPDAVVSVLAQGRVVPAGRGHFAVLTPYLRRWEAMEVRGPLHRSPT